MHWGTATRDTTAPRLQAKMAAVNRSRMDLEIKMVWSPVMPDTMEP